MKKNLKVLLASTIAAVGVAASFGGAFALYKQTANDANFSIGAYTHTSSGTVTYKAGAVASSLGENKISPDHPTVEYKVPLGGVYSSDIPAQDYIYGNLKVDITIPEAVAAKTRWCVYVDGYNSGSYWDTEFDNLRRLTGPKVDDKDPYVGTTTSVNKDVAVNAVENPTTVARPEEGNPTNQWVVVYVDFRESLTAENFMNYAEGTFKVDITFDKVSASCARPQIFGDGNSWSKESPDYGMVPNIGKNDGWEWEFKNIVGFGQLLVYVKDGENEYYVKNTSGENLVVDPAKTYDAYVAGINGDRNSLYTDSSTETNYILG